MTLRDLRRVLAQGRRVLFPTSLDVVLENTPQWLEVEDEWLSQKRAFNLQTEDADVLHVGCGDGRLLHVVMSENSPARLAVGIRGPGQSQALIDWPTGRHRDRIQIHDDVAYLDAFDPASFDLIVCDDIESVFRLESFEAGLDRLYALLRPGGEAVVKVGCAGGGGEAGFGVLTASSWIMMFMRAGFELAHVIRSPVSGDDEAVPGTDADTGALQLHLLRPWEAWELERLRTTDEPVASLPGSKKG